MLPSCRDSLRQGSCAGGCKHHIWLRLADFGLQSNLTHYCRILHAVVDDDYDDDDDEIEETETIVQIV